MAEDVKPVAVAPWNTSVSAGVNLSRGNTRNMLLNGSVVSEYKKEMNEAKMGVEGNYGETEVTLPDGSKETQGNVENSRAFVDYRRLLNARTYGYLNGDLRNDNIAEIDYRLMTGPGIGQYLLKSAVQNLGVEAGASYIKEKVAGLEDDKMALRVGERYDFKMSDTAKVWESVEYLPAFEDFGDYLLNAEVGAEAAMNARVSLRLVLQDKFDSTPGAGLKKNDLVIIGGLACKL
jgi:putative salt-induced outer membrane protein YdiY